MQAQSTADDRDLDRRQGDGCQSDGEAEAKLGYGTADAARNRKRVGLARHGSAPDRGATIPLHERSIQQNLSNEPIAILDRLAKRRIATVNPA
ncbi:hypothetical protein [Methylobacterium sp. 1030]|uniref:hypothetical protein n=1 Tax=Methylobacterium sp. 1030 TaxID=3156404 RepID=UPI0033961AAD